MATPIMFLMPDSMTDGFVDKTFGLLIAGNVATHSWVGLNYVARDYVPKISKGLLPPARVLCAAVSVLTFVGMGRVAIASPGGLKACVKGLWNPKPKEQ